MAVYKNKQPTKDGRSWYYKVYKKDCYGNNIAYKSKKYMTKTEAKEEERLFLIKRNNPINKNFDLLVKDYFKYLSVAKKESTLYSYESIYKNHIKPYFGSMDVKDINISTIQNWKEELYKKHYKIRYLNRIYDSLKVMFDYINRNYGFQINYVQSVGRFIEKKEEIVPDSEKLRYITYEEFNKFINCINDHLWFTFFTFLYYTGVRKGEAQALTWKDIDFNNNKIIINKTLSVKTKDAFKITSTKNNTNRNIAMNKLLKEILANYKKEVKKYTNFSENWFVFGNSRFLPQTTIDRMKHKYFEKSGVREITIHEFRHSCVSLLINEYIKNSSNSKIDSAKFFLIMSNRMGHTIDVMQKTYMHLFPNIQDEIVDLLDNL